MINTVSFLLTPLNKFFDVMKGIFIFEQMEIVLSVEGEEFCQGNSLLCNLVVKNRGDGPRSISDLQINLCHSKLGKGKKKGEESLFIISSAPPIASVEIAPGENGKNEPHL